MSLSSSSSSLGSCSGGGGVTKSCPTGQGSSHNGRWRSPHASVTATRSCGKEKGEPPLTLNAAAIAGRDALQTRMSRFTNLSSSCTNRMPSLPSMSTRAPVLPEKWCLAPQRTNALSSRLLRLHTSSSGFRARLKPSSGIGNAIDLSLEPCLGGMMKNK